MFSSMRLSGLPDTHMHIFTHIVTQSQTASARQDPVEPEIKKMEQELLLYINEGYKESLRLTCWDYGGQAEFLTSTCYRCVHLVHVPGH